MFKLPYWFVEYLNYYTRDGVRTVVSTVLYKVSS